MKEMVLPKTFNLTAESYDQLIQNVEQFLLREAVQSNDNVSINYIHKLDNTYESEISGTTKTVYNYKYHAIITIQFAEARFLDPSK